MSDKPEIELDLDLQLLPAWARQPQVTNRYADFDSGPGDRERRGPRGPGREGPYGVGFRREGRGGERRPGRGPRQEGGGGGRPQRGGDQRGPGRLERGRRQDGPPREPKEEFPEGVTVDLVPENSGVDSLTRQIRQTGRAYPLFDIGHLILKRPDRYQLDFRISGTHQDGTPRQFFVCSLDDTLWMSEGDAMRHVLTRHFDTFYQTEKIPVDPPRGTYTFVAQCGMSGVILGPPNLHDYQTKLQRLHAERFSRVPFDVYKSRVRIVRDEAVVKRWIEEQSFRFEYVCLNLPEPLKLNSREAVEQHFRQVHLPNIIRGVTTHTVRTPAAREALPPPLRRLARREFELQQRFPLKLVTRLSEDFAHRGLHFFKVNKTVLHVAVARPRHLDSETNPVSDGIKRILKAIDETPACTRRKLLESLGVPLPQTPEPSNSGSPQPEAPPSPELQAIVTDLHWLIHEGHVIEFANGVLETAKKPAPRPMPVPRAAPAGPKTATAASANAPASPAEDASTEASAMAPHPSEPAGTAAPETLLPEVATPPDEPPPSTPVADLPPAQETAGLPSPTEPQDTPATRDTTDVSTPFPGETSEVPLSSGDDPRNPS
jgi:hypothetical protein